jgi:lysosomal acid lipase/cholesteryl ester hydrolase
MFDHIHGLTGQKIHYLGHSLGTLIGFASFSEKGLVDQVRSAAMLSPVAYLSHMTTVIGDIAAKTFLAEVPSFSLVIPFFILIQICAYSYENNLFIVFQK